MKYFRIAYLNHNGESTFNLEANNIISAMKQALSKIEIDKGSPILESESFENLQGFCIVEDIMSTDWKA